MSKISYHHLWDAAAYSGTQNFHGTGVYYSDCTAMGRAFTYVSSSLPYFTAPETPYRDRTRVQIWTCYFKKITTLEADSYPMEENISNIQEWVQYRAR